MHIGFDAKRFFHNPTGLGNYARSTVLGLALHYPQHRYILYNARGSEGSCTISAKADLVVHEACPLGRVVPALWRTFGIPRAAEADSLDIFHGLSHELPLTRFARRTRTVVSMHDLLFLTHPHLYPWLDRHIYALKYKVSCQRADLVVAISQKTAEDVHNLFGIPWERIRVAYQSCAEIFSRPIDRAELDRVRRTHALPGDYVLFVGSLVARKGVQTLVAALAEIPASSRPGLVIVGTGPLEESLRAQVRALGLEAWTRFAGRVQDEALAALYRMATVFVYPSVGEGFGIPILEALHSRVPVITSTGSCFTEPGGDAALYTTPGDVTELAKTIDRVMGDQSLRQSMIARGLAQAEKFQPSRTSARLMDVYAELGPSR
ncbi:MAG: glycosyltransferase family 4 protein [Desulfovibrionales bacterium]|nr:glycosyltransferase family 4 protein [Desulfovibrionales bacterium]